MTGRFGRLLGLALLALGLVLTLILGGGPSPAAQAETGKKALILASSVSGGASSAEATEAAANGFAVTLVDDATWAAMTKNDFADYQMVVVGDPTCSYLNPVVSQNAQALADAVMDNGTANTKAGNRVLIGTDPVYHYSQGGNKMVASAIDFVSVVEDATSLYLDFTCGDPDFDGNGTADGLDKLLPLLSVAPTPTWTENTSPPCGGSASLIANNDQFASLSSADVQGWFCSVHESFPQYPTDWNPLAVATDTPTAPTCGNDVDTGNPVCGEAYLLIAGSGIVSTAPDLELTPTTAENPVGTTHTVTATVTNPDDTPRTGVLVSFVVTGANSGAAGTCAPASCETDGAGEVDFTYTGANPGDDTVNASITVDGSTQTATAAKTWVVPTGTEGPFGDPTCSNGVDDDGDGLTDAADPDCAGGPPPSGKCFGQTPTITGNGVVNGTPGDDVILTGSGADTVRGLGGDDLICTGRGDDFVRGGAGDDKILAGGGADNAGGSAGDDLVRGVGGNDAVQGDGGDDTVRGGTGDDRINGGPGADVLTGGPGKDRLTGGSDAPDSCNGDGDTDSTGGGCEILISIP